MDACIRGGHWLNLSTPWYADSTWEPRPCFSEIKKGSFFPGTGVATFNTSGERRIMLCLTCIEDQITLFFHTHITTALPGLKMEEAGITVEIFGSWTGTTLSLQSTGFEYVLRELDGNKDVKVCTHYTVKKHVYIINEMLMIITKKTRDNFYKSTQVYYKQSFITFIGNTLQ